MEPWQGTDGGDRAGTALQALGSKWGWRPSQLRAWGTGDSCGHGWPCPLAVPRQRGLGQSCASRELIKVGKDLEEPRVPELPQQMLSPGASPALGMWDLCLWPG